MSPKIVLLIPFLLCGVLGLCNTVNFEEKDSLLNEINIAPDTKSKVQKQADYVKKLTAYSVDSALVYLEDIIDEYHLASDSVGIARSISLKAYTLCFASRYEEAMKLARNAYGIQKRSMNDTAGLALTLVRMGLASYYFDRLDEAESRMKEALSYFKSIDNDLGIELALNNLGVFKSAQQDNEGAISYYKQSLAIRKKLNSPFWVAYSQFNIAESYRDLGYIDSFQTYILRSKYTFEVEAKTGIPAMVKMSLAEYYKLQGETAKGINLIEEALRVSEGRGNTEMVVVGKQQLSDFLYASGQYKKAYETRLEFDSIKYVLDSTNNASEVAEIEEKYANAKNRAEIEELKVEKFEAEREGRTRVILLLGLLALAILVGYRIWERSKRTQIQKENEKLELQASLEKTKLLALRSQMNPHFLFNSINLAQSYILSADKQKAYEHLEKFAKLLRMTLDSSDKIFVSLEDEIEMVRLYLELEQDRFQPKFNYELQIDEALQNGVYEIPGMIIQPLVENALIHGILNLEDKAGIVRVKLEKQANRLYCEVIDNGVGREVAKQIKRKKNQRLRSIALYNVAERTAIIAKHTNEDIKIVTEDVWNNQELSGTKVSFTFPLV